MTEDIQLAPGISKKILRAGDGSEPPKTGDTITVHYHGALEDGSKFDSSYDRDEPFETEIGVGRVIKGWDVGMMTMCPGEKAILTIDGANGYGASGSPPKIPPNATLVFTVELLKINGREALLESDEELMAGALKLKEEATEKFKAQDLQAAEDLWFDSIEKMGKLRVKTDESKKLAVQMLQNVALVQNKIGEHSRCVATCTKALSIDDKAVKALFHRSTAYMKLKSYDLAQADCKAAIVLAPSDKSFRDQWEKIKTLKTEAHKTEAEAMQKAFAAGLYNEKKVTIKKDLTRLPKFSAENPQVFFDMAIGEPDSVDYVKERVVFELFADVPKTCENFRALCTGEKGGNLHYKGNKFHRIISGFMMQGGDTTRGNGTGGESIYGEKFADEGIWYPHTHKGVLSMANAGPNTNGSQFFICYGATPHLNEKHTIFGRVIHNYAICEKAEAVKTGAQDVPSVPVQIVDCGELTGDDKMKAEDCDFLSSYE